ncbi:MAG: multidrug effflux MFS transporter [Gemmobacter sp.]|uniref:multidrug effflux MFS transporter n=1 Tax=Gemmobacter sp. TaxID=1898957 RepID=UPI001A54028F|nr:multidrug effflux MFS transporter [Gemmobacter sp.]MBL8563752.1 multidrug effflux MFS transporter [Gemmobacter sp.]
MRDLPPPHFLDPATPPSVLTLTLLAGVSALSMNIFLPSLPSMAAWYGVPYATMQLSVALYLALSAGLQILIGPVSDRFGRRKVVLGALVLFLIATLAVLLAPTAETFLIARMAQAVVAAGMVLSRAIVRDMVSDARAASMIGYVTMGMSLVPMVGPVIGGVLDDLFGWQASFAFLLICGLAVTWLCWRDLGETSRPSGLGLGAQVAQYPRLLASQRFWGYALAAALSSGCFFAYLGGAPYVGTAIFGLTSSQIGLLFALTALGYAGGNFLAGRFSERLGMNRMVLWGGSVTVLACGILVLCSLGSLMTAPLFFGLTGVMGLGNGICLPNANAGILSVRPELAGTASGLGGAIVIGGGAGLAALAGHLLPPGATELPLVLLMLGCALGSVLAILWVMARARALGM